jgi:TIR domain
MSPNQPPRVFFSHSWQDKEQVRPLAVALRSQGADVWFDEWEIEAGDSLVQKINDGLTDCTVFLVAISKASVESKWVLEELSSAVVKRIEQSAVLIPLRVDDTPVPQIINHLLYVKLDPVDEAAKVILKRVFQVSDKPPVGAPPSYIQQGLERQVSAIPSLGAAASPVLRELFKRSRQLEHPFYMYVDTADLGQKLGLGETEFDDALELLEERGAIEPLDRYTETLVKVTPTAWEYLSGELDFNLRRAMQTVAQITVACKSVDGPTLERETGLPLEHLQVAVGVLERLNLVDIDVGGIGAGRPYGWLSVDATRRTREWLAMHGL